MFTIASIEALRAAGISDGNITEENMGYLSGYVDEEKRKEIQTLFNVKHPVFDEEGITGEEAFLCGFLNITLSEYRKRKELES